MAVKISTLLLVEIERILVIELERRVLVAFFQIEIADREHGELGAHEAAKSIRVRAVGSPRTLKLVLTRTGQPVLRLNVDSKAWNCGLVSA
jgi:hypothetical protein